MKNIYTIIFLISLVLVVDSLVADELSIVPEQESIKTQQEQSTGTPNFLHDEIAKLNFEVENLRDSIMQKEQEAKKLQDELSDYKKKEELDNTRNLRIQRLKRILNMPTFSNSEISDESFNKAYSAIMLNNLDAAKSYLITFIGKEVKEHPRYKKIIEVEEEVETKKELIKDPLNLNSEKSNQPEITSEDESDTLNTENITKVIKKEEVVDQEFVNAYQHLVNKANYLIGEINLVNMDPIASVPHLVDAYNKSYDPDIIIFSLIGITESYHLLKRNQEACLSIQRIDRTVPRIVKEYPDYKINADDLEFIKSIKKVSGCNLE